MMDKYINQLQNIEVEPKSTSWLKLENKLQENNVDQQNHKKYRLLWSTIAASIVLMIAASFFFTLDSNNGLDALDGFVIEDIDQTSSIFEGIYDIAQLEDLKMAYSKNIIESNSN